MEDSVNVTVDNGTVPKACTYIATDLDKDSQFLINGKDNYLVPWNQEEIYYVLFILKKTGK